MPIFCTSYIEASRNRHLGGYLGRDPLLGVLPLFCGRRSLLLIVGRRDKYSSLVAQDLKTPKWSHVSGSGTEEGKQGTSRRYCDPRTRGSGRRPRRLLEE